MCATVGATAACLSETGDGVCGRPIPVLRRCHRPHCPACCWAWATRQARRMTRELLWADLVGWLEARPNARPSDWSQRVLDDDRDGAWQFVRVVQGVVSFDVDKETGKEDGEWVGEDRYRKARKEACDVVKGLGVNGGYRVPHPYRIDDAWKPYLRDAGYGGEGVDGRQGSLWDGVHEDALALGDWRRYVEHGLHTHVVGVSGQRGTSDADVETLDGPDLWDRFDDPDTVADAYRVCRYFLTHAAPPSGTRVAGQFGDLHPAATENAKKRLEDLWPEKGAGNLERMAEAAIEEVLNAVLGAQGRDGEDEPDRCCPDCGGDEYVSVFDLETEIEKRELGEDDVDRWQSLDVARALSRWGTEAGAQIAENRALAHGFIDEDDLGEIDYTDPSDVRRLFGLEDPEPDDAPAEPPPSGSVRPPDDVDEDPLNGLFAERPGNWRDPTPLRDGQQIDSKGWEA